MKKLRFKVIYCWTEHQIISYSDVSEVTYFIMFHFILIDICKNKSINKQINQQLNLIASLQQHVTLSL